MKFIILSLALVAIVAAQQDKPIAILKQAQDSSPDGAYSFNYETENGIVHAESGSPVPDSTGEKLVVAAQGEYHYTAPDGTPISVNYVADANGFQPQGAHIPQDHPVPALIQRALEYIAAHPPQPEN